MSLLDIYQFVQGHANSENPALAFTFDVTAGSDILVYIEHQLSNQTGTTNGCADNYSSSYTRVQEAQPTANSPFWGELWLAENVAGGSGFTVTIDGSVSDNNQMCCVEILADNTVTYETATNLVVASSFSVGPISLLAGATVLCFITSHAGVVEFPSNGSLAAFWADSNGGYLAACAGYREEGVGAGSYSKSWTTNESTSGTSALLIGFYSNPATDIAVSPATPTLAGSTTPLRFAINMPAEP